MIKEETIQHYMKSLDISREEAEQLYEDDKSDTIGEEGEELTRKAKLVSHREKSLTPRETAKRERKINKIKGFLLDEMREALEKLGVGDIKVYTETEMDFSYDEKVYTLKLTEHRKNWQRKK